MAITKIFCMKESTTSGKGRHLKSAIEYITNKEKTQNGRFVSSINCQVDTAYEQMLETKSKFNRLDKRQGYHLIVSFQEEEVDPDIAFEITEKFVAEYMGDKYEAVYVVHDNTENVHAHIVFNSVSFFDGRKYRYEKGDWAKDIQPITNRLCEEYGLSIIDIEEERSGKKKANENYKEWNEYRDGKFVWSDMIKRDIDACILQAMDFRQFEDMLIDKGYDIKHGKYFAVKPPGMNRFRRCNTLGELYSEESIKDRILKEDLAFYQQQNEIVKPKIVKCYVKRYRRGKLTKLQKRYYSKLYKLGKLKKKPYSQVWKYKDDIKKMQQLQKQYLFLSNHEIASAEELALAISNLSNQKKEIAKERSSIYKSRRKYKELFDIVDAMKGLESSEIAFTNGDDFFIEEHKEWISYENQLNELGYSKAEVEKLRTHFDAEISSIKEKGKVVLTDLKIGDAIWKDVIAGVADEDLSINQDEKDIDNNREIKKEISKEQPRK